MKLTRRSLFAALFAAPLAKLLPSNADPDLSYFEYPTVRRTISFDDVAVREFRVHYVGGNPPSERVETISAANGYRSLSVFNFDLRERDGVPIA